MGMVTWKALHVDSVVDLMLEHLCGRNPDSILCCCQQRQVVIVLALAYGALRTSVLSGMQTTPLLRMVVGLGLVCGGAGYVAIGKMGGNADVWLAYWEVGTAQAYATLSYQQSYQGAFSFL